MISVAEHDIDGFTRRAAEKSTIIIKGWIKEWSETPSPIDLRLREKERITSKGEEIKGHNERALALMCKSILVSE